MKSSSIKPRLSTIIVNYNTSSLLEQCLENLNKVSSKNNRIIVVDNNSNDFELKKFQKKFSTVTFIRNIKNIGLAAANNQALKQVRSKYVLFLGTDAFPYPETIEGIVDYLDRNESVGIATSELILRSGAIDSDAHRGFPTPLAVLGYFLKLHKRYPKSKIWNKYQLGWKNWNKPQEIEMCISHFMWDPLESTCRHASLSIL